MLCSSTLALDVFSAKEVSENCKMTMKDGKIVSDNRAWCNFFIWMEAEAIANSDDKICLDSTWTGSHWKSYFLSYSIGKKNASVSDVLKIILNRKHKCKLEVI